MQTIYNTLTRKKEVFTPIEPGKVKMYVCGPTVYDYFHIGNARTFTAFDMVFRWLKASGYEGHPLEVLLVRVLFCLFADDTGIFQPAQAFRG